MALFASRHRTRTLTIAAVIAGCAATLAAVASCVIADPPPDLPALPRHHPIIVKGSVVPPYGAVLAELPSKFVVPIELIDPETSFEYEVFIDYDGTNPRQPADVAPPGPITPTPSDIDGGIETIEFAIPSTALDPAACHRIELVVALGFDFRFPHTPDANGADSIVWLYNPSGDPGSCPRYDAGGTDGAFPDTGPLIPPDDAGGS
jgi:hypothetical protein